VRHSTRGSCREGKHTHAWCDPVSRHHPNVRRAGSSSPAIQKVPSGVSVIAVQCFETSAFALGTSARHRVRFLFRAARHQHTRRQVGVHCPGRRRRVGAFSHRLARDGRSAEYPREGKTIWPSKEESTRSCHPAWLGFDFQGPAEEAVIAVQAPIRADKNSGHQRFKNSFCS
jgi:hypothetical protein